MKHSTLKMLTTGMVSAAALVLAVPASAQPAQNLPLDKPAYAGNVRLACTGIGSQSRQNPRWNNYPVKFVTVGGYGQYLAGEDITLRRSGRDELLHVKCGGPWLLMHLPAGGYTASVDVPGAMAKTVHFNVAENGHREVVVRFPSKMAGDEND